MKPTTSIESQVRANSQVFHQIRSASRIVVTTHRVPDADGLASCLAFAGSVRQLGKNVAVITPDAPPRRFRYLDRHDEILALDTDENAAHLMRSADLVLMFDSSDIQFGSAIRRILGERRVPVLVVDHHRPRGRVQGLLVEDSSSTGELCYWMLRELGAPVNEHIAELLYTAMSYDTLSFRYVRNNPDTLRCAAALLELGADADRVQQRTFQCLTPDSLRFLSRTLASAEYLYGARFGLVAMRSEATSGLDIDRDDYRDLIQSLISVETVQVAAIANFNEQTREIKLSLRSKFGYDVEPIARKYGGGGHAQACGATVHRMSMERFLDALRTDVGKVLTG